MMSLLLNQFTPRPKLIVRETQVLEPRYPVIDAHNHLSETFGGGWCNRPVGELLQTLDEAHVSSFVDLDGGWGEQILHQRLDKYKTAAPERFAIFGGVNWDAWPEKGHRFAEWAAKRLQAQVRRGAQGLKIWKPFGLSVRDPQGRLAPVDDPRLEPIWATAGELGVPVTIHVADPAAFFDPLDSSNERWEELHAHPDWQFPSPTFPPFAALLEQLANLVTRHPQTIFIGAHVGCCAEDLGWVSRLLERCPNFYVDIAARIGELGRQPYSARRFFLRYPDRILFGTDFPAFPAWYRLHYRFLETDDEYFNYQLSDPPSQGRWRIYGLDLPDEVLAKVYYRNAQKIIFKKDQN
jgi:predicted TIM-barrel fold metal-dependent hydrolase